jgi:hypothetical protein
MRAFACTTRATLAVRRFEAGAVHRALDRACLGVEARDRSELVVVPELRSSQGAAQRAEGSS